MNGQIHHGPFEHRAIEGLGHFERERLVVVVRLLQLLLEKPVLDGSQRHFTSDNILPACACLHCWSDHSRELGNGLIREQKLRCQE